VIFCTKKCERPHLKNPSLLDRKMSALDKYSLPWLRKLWILKDVDQNKIEWIAWTLSNIFFLFAESDLSQLSDTIANIQRNQNVGLSAGESGTCGTLLLYTVTDVNCGIAESRVRKWSNGSKIGSKGKLSLLL